jgi:hypothetical protein
LKTVLCWLMGVTVRYTDFALPAMMCPSVKGI